MSVLSIAATAESQRRGKTTCKIVTVTGGKRSLYEWPSFPCIGIKPEASAWPGVAWHKAQVQHKGGHVRSSDDISHTHDAPYLLHIQWIFIRHNAKGMGMRITRNGYPNQRKSIPSAF